MDTTEKLGKNQKAWDAFLAQEGMPPEPEGILVEKRKKGSTKVRQAAPEVFPVTPDSEHIFYVWMEHKKRPDKSFMLVAGHENQYLNHAALVEFAEENGLLGANPKVYLPAGGGNLQKDSLGYYHKRGDSKLYKAVENEEAIEILENWLAKLQGKTNETAGV